MPFAPKTLRWAIDQADFERSVGVEDRPAFDDPRVIIPFDLSSCGGGNYEAVPIARLTKYVLRDATTNEEKMRGTMKQVLRWLSRDTLHTLAFDHFH